jgi:hypothetical protein
MCFHVFKSGRQNLEFLSPSFDLNDDHLTVFSHTGVSLVLARSLWLSLSLCSLLSGARPAAAGGRGRQRARGRGRRRGRTRRRRRPRARVQCDAHMRVSGQRVVAVGSAGTAQVSNRPRSKKKRIFFNRLSVFSQTHPRHETLRAVRRV